MSQVCNVRALGRSRTQGGENETFKEETYESKNKESTNKHGKHHTIADKEFTQKIKPRDLSHPPPKARYGQ